MIIAMWGSDFVEMPAAISRFPHLIVGYINGVYLHWISKDMSVIPGPVDKVAVGATEFPALAIIV
jgi:hypothetical protein